MRRGNPRRQAKQYLYRWRSRGIVQRIAACGVRPQTDYLTEDTVSMPFDIVPSTVTVLPA